MQQLADEVAYTSPARRLKGAERLDAVIYLFM